MDVIDVIDVIKMTQMESRAYFDVFRMNWNENPGGNIWNNALA